MSVDERNALARVAYDVHAAKTRRQLKSRADLAKEYMALRLRPTSGSVREWELKNLGGMSWREVGQLQFDTRPVNNDGEAARLRKFELHTGLTDILDRWSGVKRWVRKDMLTRADGKETHVALNSRVREKGTRREGTAIASSAGREKAAAAAVGTKAAWFVHFDPIYRADDTLPVVSRPDVPASTALAELAALAVKGSARAAAQTAEQGPRATLAPPPTVRPWWAPAWVVTATDRDGKPTERYWLPDGFDGDVVIVDMTTKGGRSPAGRYKLHHRNWPASRERGEVVIGAAEFGFGDMSEVRTHLAELRKLNGLPL